MARRRIWIGSMGPFLYDTEDDLPSEPGESSGVVAERDDGTLARLGGKSGGVDFPPILATDVRNPDPGQIVRRFVPPLTLNVVDNGAGRSQTTPNVQVVVDLLKNGSVIGGWTFSSSSVTPTFSASNIEITSGDNLEIRWPDPKEGLNQATLSVELERA